MRNPTRPTDANNILTTLLYVLERTPRNGATQDMPEGSRWIEISDTYALELAASVRKHNNDQIKLMIEADYTIKALCHTIEQLQAKDATA